MIINSEQIVTRAKMRLRLMETQEHDSYLLKLAEEAARGLNASSTYKIQCKEVEIDCHKAKLPDCYDELVLFKINGCCGNCTQPIETIPPTPIICSCPDIFYYDKSVLFDTGGANCGWYGNYFYIQDGYIYFPSTVTADTAKIWFRGFNTDEDGLMLIDEECERGISSYIAYQFAVSYPESYTPMQVNQWNTEWIAQKSYINGKKIIREFKLQKAVISNLINAVLVNTRYSGMGRYGR